MKPYDLSKHLGSSQRGSGRGFPQNPDPQPPQNPAQNTAQIPVAPLAHISIVFCDARAVLEKA